MPPADVITRCQTILAHAWMVRTFVKHAPEVDQFPELMGVARAVFDVSRALETRLDDPAAYLQMLRKKIGKLRQAAEQFRHDAPLASTHTNFQQAVWSMDGCVRALEGILKESEPASNIGKPAPPVALPQLAVPPGDEDQTE